jgi:hypothetical protein
MQKFKNIIMKLGPNIKSLKLRACLSILDFCEILAMTPNVETLDLQFVHLRKTNAAKKRCIRDQDDLNLLHLKKLRLFCCGVEIVAVFKRLPAGVLHKLEWYYNGEKEAIEEILKKQPNITKIEIDSTTPLRLLDNLKLERFSFFCYGQDFKNDIIKVLKQQPELKSLILTVVIDNELMTAINELKQLEKLEISLYQSSTTTMSKLPKVKALKFNEINPEKIQALAELDNSHLESLSLFHINDGQLLRQIAASAPNLKSFFIYDSLYDSSINAIMRIFNYVESLTIFNTWDSTIFPNLKQLCKDEYFNAKLKKLEIYDDKFIVTKAFAKKLVALFPNLEQFIIFRETYNIQELKELAAGHND